MITRIRLSADIATGRVQIGSLAARVPSFVIADLGFGPQITTLRNGNQEWLFAPAPAVRLLVWQSPTDPRQTPVGSNELGAPTSSVVTSTGWSITWNDPAKALVTWSGSLVGDTLEWAIVATPQGALAATKRLYAVDSYFKPKPPVTANRAELYAGFALLGGQVFRNATAPLSADVYPYDFLVPTCGYTETTRAPQGPGASSAMGYSCLYDRTREIALLTSVSDAGDVFPTVEFGWNGEGSNAIWYIRHHVPDTYAATTYATPYVTRMTVVRGGWYEASRRYAAFVAADAPSWLPAQGLHNRAGFPAAVKNADLFLITGVEPGANYEASIEHVRLQVQRAVARYGTGIIVFLTWQGETEANSLWPDYVLTPSIRQLFTDLKAMGVTVLPYTLFMAWLPGGPWYTTNHDPDFGNPLDSVVRTHGDAPITLLSTAGHHLAALHSADARSHIVDATRTWLQDLGPTKVDGQYSDVVSLPAFWQYGSMFPDSDRGIGSGTIWKGARELTAATKAMHQAEGNAGIMMLEYAGEAWLGVSELLQTFTWLVTAISQSPTAMPMWESVYGEFARLWTIQTPGATPPGSPQVLLELGSELLRFFMAVEVSRGHIPTLLSPFSGGMKAFVQSGEANYADWLTQMGPYLEMLDRIASLAAWRKYSYGRRLRPQDGSWDRYLEERGFPAIYTDFVTQLAFPGTAIPSILSYSEEVGGIGGLWINFRNADVVVDLRGSTAEYPEMRSLRKLHATTGAGTRTLVKEFVHGVRHQFVVPARGCAMLEMTP